MEKFKLKINPLVAKDLQEIKEFIGEDNVAAADKLIVKLISRFDDLSVFPDLGVDLSNRVSFSTQYKYLVSGDYVIIYYRGIDFVEIYRVLNHKQDFTRIFD